MRTAEKAIVLMLIYLLVATATVTLYVETEQEKMMKRIDAIYAKEAEDVARTAELILKYQDLEYRIQDLEESDSIQNVRLAIHRDDLTDAAQMFSDLLGSYERLEEHLKSLPDNSLNVKVSEKDIRDIAALVYLEAGSQSYACQKAIASVIFNRMIRYNMTAQQTIHQNGVFSPASRVSSTKPSSSCLMAVREVLEEGTTLPRNVVAFRNGHYHTFGRRYCCIDGVYFTAL